MKISIPETLLAMKFSARGPCVDMDLSATWMSQEVSKWLVSGL